MPKDINLTFITTKVTDREYKLLEFTRRLGFGAFTLYIKEGQPQKVEQTLKSIRFDIDNGIRCFPLDNEKD